MEAWEAASIRFTRSSAPFIMDSLGVGSLCMTKPQDRMTAATINFSGNLFIVNLLFWMMGSAPNEASQKLIARF
jgi:hypothetical protein